MGKKFDDAVADYTSLLKAEPKEVRALLGRAAAFYSAGQMEKALADFAGAIELNSDFPQAYNDYAWLLATWPDEKFRNGKKALELACRACDLTEWKNGAYLDTLAASYAELGDFENAVKWQTEAVSASAEESEETKKEIESRIELYKGKKPYREEKK